MSARGVAVNVLEPEPAGRTLYLFEELTGTNAVDQITLDPEYRLAGPVDDEPDLLALRFKRPGFWRRQFGREITGKQRRYDWIFGVIMPVICFAFDPFIFKSPYGGRALLEKYTLFAYLLSFVSIMATMAWLLWGHRLKGYGAVAAGIMAGGSVGALVIGGILFPFSLVGLLFLLIGALGFSPLFTAVIWARNAVRAYRAASKEIGKQTLSQVVGLTALLSVVIPLVANAEFGRELLTEITRLMR